MRPVVLLHGIFGFQRLKVGPVSIDYFGRIERAIRDSGHPVLVPGAHPTASITRRAQQIKERIEAWVRAGGEPIIIIAHSMGGLDARYLISRLGMAEHVAALVTIATPHRGSALADFWMNNPPMRRICLPVLDALGIDVEAGDDLTRGAAAKFNQCVPDAPGVRYYSVSAACEAGRVPLPLKLGYQIVKDREGENDSMVSVESAKWGEHLGTWPVHHLHAINRRFPSDRDAQVGDVSPLYLRVIEEVEGEGEKPQIHTDAHGS